MILDSCLSPEQQLLILCARTTPSALIIEQIQARAQGKVDWHYFTELALQHGVMPLTYWNLKLYCREQIPANSYARLSRFYYMNCYHNLMLAQELVSLMQSLKETGIPALPFKGPTLALSVYGDLSFRQINDLDIIVPQQDILRARDLLLSSGYNTKFVIEKAHEKLFINANHAYNFIRRDNHLICEVHWRVVPRYFSFPLKAETLLQQATTVTMDGVTVAAPSPEHLLLILCGHAAKHCWDRLSLVCDIAELVRAYPILDWNSVHRQASAWGLTRILFLGLMVAQDVFGVPLPDEMLEAQSQDRAVHGLVNRARNRLFARNAKRITEFSRMSYHLRSRERSVDRLRYLFHFCCTPNLEDLRFIHLPGRLSFLYKLVRPVRLFALEPIMKLLPNRLKQAIKNFGHWLE